MLRQAFHYIAPFCFGQTRIAIVAASLLVSAAVGSPINTSELFLPAPLRTEALFLWPESSLLPLAPSESFRGSLNDLWPSDSALPATSLRSVASMAGDLSNASYEADTEKYPYILLTLGLIVLAFRPANAVRIGRS